MPANTKVMRDISTRLPSLLIGAANELDELRTERNIRAKSESNERLLAILCGFAMERGDEMKKGTENDRKDWEIFEEELTRRAKILGYESWIEAYHLID